MIDETDMPATREDAVRDGMLPDSAVPEFVVVALEHIEALGRWLKNAPKLAHNNFRLLILNWLGVTYALREVNKRHLAISEAQERTANAISHIVQQINRTTENLARMHQKHREWEAANPGLRRVTMKLEAAQAAQERAKRAPTNGHGAAIIAPTAQEVDAIGAVRNEKREDALEDDIFTRRRKLLETVGENFAKAQAGREALWEPYPEPDGQAGELVPFFMGKPLTDDEREVVKAEQERLVRKVQIEKAREDRPDGEDDAPNGDSAS